MKNNAVLFIMLTSFLLPNYASAQTGSSNSTSNGGQDRQYSNPDPTMEIVAVVLVCVFFLIGFISVFFGHCSEEAPSTRIARLGTASGGRGLDPAVIDSFPVLAYISVKELKIRKVSGELECAVCLSEFEELDSLKLLPNCNHVFHPECIDAWLASHVTCPVCRANLELKLEPNSCPRCGIVNDNNSNSRSSSSSSNSNSDNNNDAVTNSILSESNSEQQQQPLVSVSIVVNSEDQHQEEHEERKEVLGKLMRSHSTGHSLVLQQVNMEKYNLGLPEQGRFSVWEEKECMRRCSSYEVVLDLGSGSSSGRSDKFEDFTITPPPSGGGGGQRLFTSTKMPFSFLGLKTDEEQQWRNRPPL